MGGEILVLWFLGSLLFGLVPAFIAKGKGRSFFPWYIYSVFLFLIAMIHAIVIKPNERAPGKMLCPSCREVIANSASTCPFCRRALGSSASHAYEQPPAKFPSASGYVQRSHSVPFDRSLESDEYQLYLVQTYNIEKNNTLEKYVVKGKVFPSLADALKFAHRLDVGAATGMEVEDLKTWITYEGEHLSPAAIEVIIRAKALGFRVTITRRREIAFEAKGDRRAMFCRSNADVVNAGASLPTPASG